MITGSILVVDDEPEMLENCRRLLERDGHQCTLLGQGSEFLATVRESQPDVVLCDLRMPDVDGMELLAASLGEDPELPFILVTGYATVNSAVEAIQQGAFDYLAKPFTGQQLRAAITKALRQRVMAKENRRLRDQVARQQELDEILGDSPVMLQLKEKIRKVAPIDVNVLVWGESGTGKELVAKSLHYRSLRGDQPFVPVDCATIPETLIESVLFGHEKGAFTGAASRQRGLLEESNGGTLFLDEVTQLDPHLQSRLLRVLQEREMRRVGGDRVIKLDIRVVAATNLEPTSAIQEGMLREDLYYRLNVIPIVLPPLRERGSDVELLFKSFLERFAAENGKRTPKVTPSVWRTVEEYSWPGNVREMLNVAQRVIILDDDDSITMSDLPRDLREGTKSFSRGEPVLDIPYRDARRQAIQTFQDLYLEELLAKHEGNISRAAEAAGLSRRTLHRWLERNHSEGEAT